MDVDDDDDDDEGGAGGDASTAADDDDDDDGGAGGMDLITRPIFIIVMERRHSPKPKHYVNR